MADFLFEHSCFDLGKVAKEHRYDVWSSSISCIFDVEVAKVLRGSDRFSATIEAFRLGDIFFAQTRTVEQIWRRRPIEIAQDGMDHFMIQLYIDGEMSWQSGQRSGLVRSGDLIVFDLGREMASQTTSFNNLSLIIPRHMLAPKLNDPDAHHMQHLSAEHPLPGMLYEYILMLHSHLPALSPALVEKMVPSALEMIATCLNHGTDSTQKSSPIEREWLMGRRARMYMRRNLGNASLDVQTVCDDCNISRSSLYRMFSEEGGVRAFLQEERLIFALQKLMKRPELQISTIAERSGFKLSNDFSRAFRKRFNMSPSGLRALYASRKGTDILPAHVSGIDRKYENWLRNLGT
ncbi:helix-turn-helix domain-containing protein [Thalassospira marina]|nr:helix-turn-helix domain-containing protein [Thalassospira marina]